MLKKLFLITVVMISVQLSGCATNANSANMIASPPINQTLQNKSLKNNIKVTAISGGHETNPLWTSQVNNEGFKLAIVNSLKLSELYSENAKYALNVNLIKLKQPLFGLDLKVICQAHYILQDQISNKIIFDREITTAYTATLKDSILAIERLKMANEGAVKANIGEFLKQLYKQP